MSNTESRFSGKSIGIKWVNLQEFNTKLEVMKQAEKAEKAALNAGGNYLKRIIKTEAMAALPNASKQNPKYSDKLIDAVRRTKPYKDRAALSVHIYGSRKKTSGTYRLRFFESNKDRYQKKIGDKLLKKKRYVGNLAKFNGFFKRGYDKAKPNINSTMQAALEKYIMKNW